MSDITTKRVPVIHIGMPKTATKTFQWRLFKNHSEVLYLGRFDGYINNKYRQFKNCLDTNTKDLMSNLCFEHFKDPDMKKSKELIFVNIREKYTN